VRIAMISPLEIRVPPVAYGGTELIVSLLTEELVRRGHDVTLFASGDSITSAKLVSVHPTFVRGSGRDVTILNMLNVLACLEQADDFDIIHNHTLFEGLSTAGFFPRPMVTTLHGNLTVDQALLFRHYKGWYVTISHSSKSLLPPKDKFAGVVHNAIDVPSYPFNAGRREDSLLYLSRISEEKGPHIAIDIARRLGKRLILAGNVNSGPDRDFFLSRVLPQVDGNKIVYVGEVDGKRKRELLTQASCLLAPIVWPEPFGLFMAEAMACGMPVVAFRQGAAPEVVQDGVSGFVVDTIDQMASAIGRVGDIDPYQCRRVVEEKFDVPIMVDRYIEAYGSVLAAERTAPVEENAPEALSSTIHVLRAHHPAA